MSLLFSRGTIIGNSFYNAIYPDDTKKSVQSYSCLSEIYGRWRVCSMFKRDKQSLSFLGQKDTSHLSAQSLIVARSLFICWLALISSEKSMKRVVSSAKKHVGINILCDVVYIY